MPDSAAPSVAPSRRPSLPSTSRPLTSRRSSTAGATAASPTHSSHQTTPALSRHPSTSQPSSTSTTTPARSRSHSVSKSQQQQQQATAATKSAHLPSYIHFINSYTPSSHIHHTATAATAAHTSPFLSSPLYTLTPHETSLLFQHYTTTPPNPPTTPHNPTTHSLTREQFTTLLVDWLHQLKRKGSDSELATTGVVLDGVHSTIDSIIANGSEVANQLFVMLDVNSNERIERDEFKLFLASVDTVVGGRIRAEWKKAIIVPRLKAIAAL